MSVGILIKAEAIKIAKLRGFWLILGGYIVFLVMVSDSVLDQTRRTPVTFPTGWPVVMEFFRPITFMLCCSLVVIMVSTEFMWRTARQNVIDGLSKTEWYFAKLLSILLMAASFVVLGLVVLVGYTMVGGIEVVGGQLMRASDIRLLGAVCLGLLGYMSFGFFLSLTVRNPGAVALFLAVYSTFIEVIIVQLLKMKEYTTIAKFFLMSTFLEVGQPWRWDPVAYEAIKRFNRLPKDAFSNGEVIALSSLYILIFLGASYVILQKRDL